MSLYFPFVIAIFRVFVNINGSNSYFFAFGALKSQLYRVVSFSSIIDIKVFILECKMLRN